MKAVRLLVWLAGGALCAGMTLALGPVDQPEIVKHRAVVYFTLSFVGLTIGVLVWQFRPGNRTGLLLTALPLVEVLGQGKWIFWNQALPVTVAFASIALYAPLFAHLILSYPTGRLATRLDRAFVAVTYAYAALSALPLLLFFDPRYPHTQYQLECFTGCALPVTHVAWYDTDRVTNVLDWFLLPLALIFLALLVRKLVRASPVGRRIAWGAQTRSSRRGFVFVEQTAEEVAPPDLERIDGRCGRGIRLAAMIRRSQVECSVRTLLVEVADVDAEDVLELAAPEDQKPVEAFPAHATDPPFCVGIRVGRPDRRADDLDPFDAEDRVEGAAELPVAVMD